MKDREIACFYYICEGSCKKGRAGTFTKYCQHCDLYNPVRHGRPRRADTRNKKIEDARKKDVD